MTVPVFLVGAALWAQEELAKPRPRFSDVFWPSLPWFIAIALVLLIGGGILAVFDRWRKGGGRSVREDIGIAAWLRECREQRDRGEMSQEDYERIRNKVLGKSAPKADPPPAPAVPPTPPPAASEAAPPTSPPGPSAD